MFDRVKIFAIMGILVYMYFFIQYFNKSIPLKGYYNV